MYSATCDVCHKGIPRNVGYVMWIAAGKAMTAHKGCRTAPDAGNGSKIAP